MVVIAGIHIMLAKIMGGTWTLIGFSAALTNML
jgi:hypothetical protein